MEAFGAKGISGAPGKCELCLAERNWEWMCKRTPLKNPDGTPFLPKPESNALINKKQDK